MMGDDTCPMCKGNDPNNTCQMCSFDTHDLLWCLIHIAIGMTLFTSGMIVGLMVR